MKRIENLLMEHYLVFCEIFALNNFLDIYGWRESYGVLKHVKKILMISDKNLFKRRTSKKDKTPALSNHQRIVIKVISEGYMSSS